MIRVTMAMLISASRVSLQHEFIAKTLINSKVSNNMPHKEHNFFFFHSSSCLAQGEQAVESQMKSTKRKWTDI